MSGLLLKDWYMIKKDCRYVLFMVLIFAVAGLVNKTLLWIVWPSLIISTIPSSMIGLEDQAGWPLYADTFPISRRTVVSEKYVLAALLALAVALLQLVLYGVTGTAKEIGVNLLFLAAMCLLLGLLPAALMLPQTFKLGMVKGRIAYYVGIGFVAALGGGLGALVSGENTGLPLNLSSSWLISLGIILVTGVLHFLSWLLAVKFYEKREL